MGATVGPSPLPPEEHAWKAPDRWFGEAFAGDVDPATARVMAAIRLVSQPGAVTELILTAVNTTARPRPAGAPA